MANSELLNKLSKKVSIVLDKRQINNIPCQVKFVMDCSGSAKGLYDNGTIQNVTDRIFPIAFTVDMDKMLDFFLFDSKCTPIDNPVTENNFSTFIKDVVMKKASWGGTNYEPFVTAVVANAKPVEIKKGLFGLFSKKQEVKTPDPILAIVITDGENYDEGAAEKAFKAAGNTNIYWMLIGIGKANFTFIEKMGDMLPNVGFLPIDDLSAISDEDLYDGIINDEFADWVKTFTA